MSSETPLLVCADLDYFHGEQQTLHGMNLAVAANEVVALLGPSGSGKTTLLRLIAGFEQPANGEIFLRGKRVASAVVCVAPEHRQLGLVPQNYGLFPHLSVAANICFGIADRKHQAQRQTCEQLLAMVGLTGKAERMPNELSGGEQQRVALARALAVEPDLLLLDEPLSNLDAKLRETLSLELRQLLKDQGVATILVTHDQREAQLISDRIVVLDHGAVQQEGTPQQLYRAPSNRFVAEFMGDGQWLTIKRSNGTWRSALGDEGDLTIETDQGQLLLRRSDLVLDPAGAPATLIASQALGHQHLCQLMLTSGEQVEVLLPAIDSFALGDTVRVARRPGHQPIAFALP